MDVFAFFGSSVCHQMAERSFFWGSLQSPVCARCTGIEAGIVFGVLFFWLSGRKDGNRPFFAPTAVLLAVSFLPIAVDGIGSYLGFWESTQLRRVVTGAMAGYTIVPWFLLAGNFQPGKENVKPIFRHIGEPLLLLLATLLYGLAVWMGYVPYVLAGLITTVGILCFYGGFWYLLLRLCCTGRRLPFIRLALCGGGATATGIAVLIQNLTL